MTSGERRSFPLLKCFFFLVERLIPVEEANFTITAFPFLGLLGKCGFTFPTASFVRQFRLKSKEIRFYKSLKYNIMPEIQFDCVVSAVADLYTENEQK